MQSLEGHLSEIGISEGECSANGPAPLLLPSQNPEEYINDPSIEMAWAMRAFDNARVHMSLLCALEPKFLKLTESDDDIHKAFLSEFGKDFPLQLISEEQLKSAFSKARWREFSEKFKHIEDYSFGTLLRLDSSKNYDSENTILVPKIQFLAIEIARNRAGCNSELRDKYPADHSIHDENS